MHSCTSGVVRRSRDVQSCGRRQLTWARARSGAIKLLKIAGQVQVASPMHAQHESRECKGMQTGHGRPRFVADTVDAQVTRPPQAHPRPLTQETQVMRPPPPSHAAPCLPLTCLPGALSPTLRHRRKHHCQVAKLNGSLSLVGPGRGAFRSTIGSFFPARPDPSR